MKHLLSWRRRFRWVDLTIARRARTRRSAIPVETALPWGLQAGWGAHVSTKIPCPRRLIAMPGIDVDLKDQCADTGENQWQERHHRAAQEAANPPNVVGQQGQNLSALAVLMLAKRQRLRVIVNTVARIGYDPGAGTSSQDTVGVGQHSLNAHRREPSHHQTAGRCPLRRSSATCPASHGIVKVAAAWTARSPVAPESPHR